MNVLPGCMSLHHVCALCPWRPEDSIGQPGTGVTNVSRCVSGGTQTQVFRKSSQCSYLLSPFIRPKSSDLVGWSWSLQFFPSRWHSQAGSSPWWLGRWMFPNDPDSLVQAPV